MMTIQQKARTAVRNAINRKVLPSPKIFKCTDCARQAEEYDHYCGYEEKHWLSVQPTCHVCNCKRIWAGKGFSAIHRKRMSIAAMGRVLDSETRIKISLANKGRKHTEESKKNMAQSRIGGKRTEETKNRMSEARRMWWVKRKMSCIVE